MKSNNLRAWATTLSSNGIVLSCGIVTGVLTARFLHAEGRGAFAAILLFPQLLLDVGLLGVHEALTQRVASQQVGHEDSLSTAMVLCTALAGLAVLIGWLLVPVLLGPERAPLYSLARLYLTAVIPVNLLTLTFYALDHGKLRFGRYNLSRLALPVGYTLVTISLWLAGDLRIETLVAWNIAASIFALIVAAWFIRGSIRLRFVYAEAAILLSLAWRFNVTAALLGFSSQVDRLIVVKFWDDRNVGLYFVALTVSATAAKSLAHSFHTVVFPNIARRSGEQQRDYFAASLRHIMLLTSIAMVVMMAVSGWLVPILFGHEFVDAVVVARVLMLAQVPNTLRQVIVRALRGLGRACRVASPKQLRL